jgi:exodeoxyribonuclease VII small subunit
MSPSKAKTAPAQASLPDDQAPPASFEAAVAELESLVDAMDSQNLGLDQLLTDYKRGAFLVKYCRDRLSQVRQEVSEIELGLNKPVAEGDH